MSDDYMFGPNLWYLKGNNVLGSGTAVTLRDQIIPPEIMEQYREVYILMDITFVKNCPSLWPSLMVSSFVQLNIPPTVIKTQFLVQSIEWSAYMVDEA